MEAFSLGTVWECCSVLQCVAVCCSVLQFVAVCCSVLQCVATTWHDVTSAARGSWHTCEWVMAHVKMGHVTHMNADSHLARCASAARRLKHDVTSITRCTHTCKWVIWHEYVRISHVRMTQQDGWNTSLLAAHTYIHRSIRAYKGGVLHVWKCQQDRSKTILLLGGFD